MQERTARLQKDNDNLQQQLEEVAAQAAAEHEKNARMQTQIREMEDVVSNHDMLLKVVGQSEVRVTEIHDALSASQEQTQHLKTSLDELQQQMDRQAQAAEAEKTNLLATIETYREQLADVRTELDQKQNHIDEIDQIRTQERAETELMREELQALEEERSVLQTTVVDLEEELQSARNEYTMLAEEIAARDQAYQDMEHQLSQAQQKDQTITALKTDINTLQQSLTRKKRETAALNGDVTRLKDQLDKITRLRSKDRAERETLERTIKQLRRENRRARVHAATDTRTAGTTTDTVRSSPVVNTDIPLNQQVADANRELHLGHINDAERAFINVLQIDERQPGALLGLASCHYARRQYDKAFDVLNMLLENNPLDPHALALKGLIEYKRNELVPAGTTLQKALMIAPEDPKLHNYMGMVYYARKQPLLAVREFEKAIQYDPDSADAHRNLALLLGTAQSPDLDQARYHYEAALELGSRSDQRLEKILYP